MHINADQVIVSVVEILRDLDLKCLETFDEMPNAKKLWSSVAPYNWKNNCTALC